jgi:small GTP-binding protein
VPANLTPQYYAAEEKYKQAKTTAEKIEALQEMLAVIPKHKGTEKIQANLKRRLAALREKKQQRKSKSTYNPFVVEKQGAGQVIIIGFPNSGKSALVSTLTKAKVKVADFPFATTIPETGMMNFEDVQIQLVDTPPLTAGNIPPGLTGTIRAADLLLIVVDISSDECLEHVEGIFSLLKEKNLASLSSSQGKDQQPFILLANKIDLPKGRENIQILRELYPKLKIITVSAATGKNLEVLRQRVFDALRVIRVYSKPPGKPPQLEKPFILPKGSTVLDFAASIHKDFIKKIKSAHVWGSTRFDGQAVAKSYVLEDKDIVELNIN